MILAQPGIMQLFHSYLLEQGGMIWAQLENMP